MNMFFRSQSSSSGQARPTGQSANVERNEAGRRNQNGSGNELTEHQQARPLTYGLQGDLSESATPVLPPVDIFENAAGVTIIADLPGVSKDRLGVRVDGDSLVIEGTASTPDLGDMELLYGEVLSPVYRRSFTLSRDLDPGKIEASLNNGVLKLSIPKAEAAKPRRIEVRVG
jgi:HSP20 family molecular chaperone IbpA